MSIFGKPFLTGVGKGSAFGAVVNFTDGAKGLPLKSLLVDIDPVQDLHGYDNPWPAGGGINAMPPAVAKSETQNSVTVSTDGSGVYSISGTADANTVFEFPLINSFVIPDGTPVDGTHSLMLKNTFSSSGVSIYFYNGTTSLDSWVVAPVNRVAVNYSAMTNKTCDRIKVKVASGISVTGTFGIMFVPKGTASNTPFTPYSNLCPISGWSAVNVWRTGKNLFDVTERVTGQTNVNGNTSSGYALTGDTLSISKDVFNYGRVMLSAMPMKSGNYVLSFKASISGSGYIRYSVRNMGANPKADIVNPVNKNAGEISIPFSLTENADVAISIQPENNTAGTVTISDIQLEYGSTATPYTPYSGNQYTIQLGQTVYGGTLDVTNGVLTVDRAMVNLGALDWSITASGSFGARLNDGKVFSSVGQNQNDYECSIYRAEQPGSSGSYLAEDYIIWHGKGSYCYVYVRDSRYTDVDTFQAAMSGVQLVYELATSITISLTPQEISTLKGTNNVWADTGDVDVEYLKQTLMHVGSSVLI